MKTAGRTRSPEPILGTKVTRLMGGMFGLTRSGSRSGSIPACELGHVSYFANARSAFFWLIQRLKPKSVWLPSYLCPALVDAVRKAECPFKFFAIGQNLQLKDETWISTLGPGDLVLCIDYFGFGFEIADLKGTGTWVLQDACQALYAEPNWHRTDFCLLSPRKFVGVPDGGMLACGSPLPSPSELQSPPSDWWGAAYSASQLRREFDEGSEVEWFPTFSLAEASQPIGAYRMSDDSRKILENCLDHVAASASRRANYAVLSSYLGNIALFPELKPGVVPLGFPIRVTGRDRIRQVLFDNQIFPATHWTIGTVVPEEFVESHALSQSILTLPCDQRCTPDQMMHMANIVRENL